MNLNLTLSFTKVSVFGGNIAKPANAFLLKWPGKSSFNVNPLNLVRHIRPELGDVFEKGCQRFVYWIQVQSLASFVIADSLSWGELLSQYFWEVVMILLMKVGILNTLFPFFMKSIFAKFVLQLLLWGASHFCGWSWTHQLDCPREVGMQRQN